MAEWLDMIAQDRVDPEQFHEVFPWAPEMIGCPHDAVHHAEGDPWVHTKMVVGELVASEAYRAMAPNRQLVMRLAAWMHDVAKPATTEVTWDETERRERVTQRGHSPLGASMAYQGLLDAGADAGLAREVHALVFWHQRPFFLLREKSLTQRAIRFSIEAGQGSWHELLTLCRADNRGRISQGAAETLEALDLVEIAIGELGENIGCDLLHEPWPFETDEARLRYLRGPKDGSAFYMPENPGKGRMIMLSGLPGSGKDTLAASLFSGVPAVSLDDIRGQMDVGWRSKQGRALQAGFEAARVHMRAGEDFVWNATCLSRQVRQKIIGLARDYDYLVEAVSIDVPLSVACERNARREKMVPAPVMEKLGRKRDPILPDEAHVLWSLDADSGFRPLFGRDEEMGEAFPGLAG